MLSGTADHPQHDEEPTLSRLHPSIPPLARAIMIGVNSHEHDEAERLVMRLERARRSFGARVPPATVEYYRDFEV